MLFALTELIRYLLQFRSYEAKCVQLGCFRTVVDLFCTQILPAQGRLHQSFLPPKNYRHWATQQC